MNGFGWQGQHNPWHRLREMEREMSRFFEDYSGPQGASFPPFNIHTDREGAIVMAELSGVERNDLDISVHGRTLTVRGERKVPEGGGNERWLRRERAFGQFARNVDLTFAIDPTSVEATYRDGVLKIRLQRAEADKPKQIAVKD